MLALWLHEYLVMQVDDAPLLTDTLEGVFFLPLLALAQVIRYHLVAFDIQVFAPFAGL